MHVHVYAINEHPNPNPTAELGVRVHTCIKCATLVSLRALSLDGIFIEW